LCVSAYYCGETFSTYHRGQAGVIAALQADGIEVVTDNSWECLQSPSAQSGLIAKLTKQLGFVASYDARHEIDWLNPNFSGSNWSTAEVRGGATTGYWKNLLPRPAPPLTMGSRLPVQIIMQGYLLRQAQAETFAETVANDLMRPVTMADFFGSFPGPYPYTQHFPKLDGNDGATLTFHSPPEKLNGCFIISDLGAESVGLIDIEIVAAEGTVIDISHGEHLLDGRVRCKIENRNFTDRYICKKGLNKYTLPFRRIGGRYIQLNFTNFHDPVTIHYVGLRPLNVSLPPGATFCADPLADRTEAISIRTLELCMHDHYEDCPWREQALYAYDSRNQMLYGYYIWGNYDFAAASLKLLGKGIRPDGLLELCPPSSRPMTIPIFSFVWAAALNEHCLHSGSDALFRQYDAQLKFMIDKILELRNQDNGLYRLSLDQELWHFYEWAGNMSLINCPEGEYHALYNLYFHEMLCSCAQMFFRAGDKSLAEKYSAIANNLQMAINRVFWDSEKHCYASRLSGNKLDGHHEHVQFSALYNHIVPTDKLAALLENIYSGKTEGITFSAMLYMLRSMMEISPQSRQYVSETISRNFDPIIFSGATSLWETSYGGADFADAGSLCHGWSSLPTYYYHAWVLGIRPLEPGFRKFLVSPCPDRFHAAKGSVATPHGFIHVQWEKDSNGLHMKLDGPEVACPVLSALPEAPIALAVYNGRRL
jgi:hypothetical protein